MENYPEIMQIEITTKCNFNCTMCSRNTWEEKPNDISVELFEKIAKEVFPHLKRVILFGVGEPLMHPQFLKLLEISRKYLPKNGKIEFTSNGSLLRPSILNKILKYNIYRIIISIDSIDLTKLQFIRDGANTDVYDNLHYLSLKRKEGELKELAIETVLMKSNIRDLPFLVKYCSNLNIDSIYTSHLLPISKNNADEICYVTNSKKNWDFAKNLIEHGWLIYSDNIFNNAYERGYIQDLMSDTTKKVKNVEKFRENGLDLNSPKMLQNYTKIEILNETKKIFQKSKNLAENYGIKLDLPPLYANVENRQCPYISRNASIINARGDMAPCYFFLHKTKTYQNYHKKTNNPVKFGNLFKDSVQKIWNSKEYSYMRKNLKNISENIPWCGDCSYSSTNCFFIDFNDSDCYGNNPGCNECLYSAGLIKCLFDLF